MNTERFSQQDNNKIDVRAQRKVPHAWHYRINEFCGESNVIFFLKAKKQK